MALLGTGTKNILIAAGIAVAATLVASYFFTSYRTFLLTGGKGAVQAPPA